MHALHAKAAAHLLARAGGDVASRKRLREIVREAADDAPVDESRRTPGVRLSDEQVRDYIRQRFSGGRPSATALLRRLRDDGMSCEQSRFKRLYEDTFSRGVLV